MNSMFGKSFEPISQSERIKNKRNKAIFKARATSNDICLDKNGNIRNAKNYETFMNVVNGFYECKKENSTDNKECFDTYLDNKTDEFSVSNFHDIQGNFIDFQMADIEGTRESNARKNVRATLQGKNTQFNSVQTNNSGIVLPGNIVDASDMVYPYKKQGLCADYVIQNISFFDPSGNLSNKYAKNIKKHFPLTKLS